MERGRGNFSSPLRSNWSISSSDQSKNLYALSLVNIGKYRNSSSLNLRPKYVIENNIADTYFGEDSITEFLFPVNPNSISVNSPFATTITPTQDGGQFIERQGQIYNNITIQGTTGLRPNRSKPGGIIPVFSIVNPLEQDPSLDNETGLPRGEKTGFDDLNDLKNFFASYASYSVDPQYAASHVMVWQNVKEGDFYIVEPINFVIERDVSSPLTFRYTIELRTIKKFDIVQIARNVDSLKKLNSNDSFNARISEFNRKLTQSFVLATALLDRATTIGQATITNVLQPVATIIQGLNGVLNAEYGILGTPRGALPTITSNVLTIIQSLNDLNETFLYTNQGIITQTQRLANVCVQLAQTLAGICDEDRLFSTTLSNNYTNKSNAYNNPVIGSPRTGGSSTDLNNALQPSGTGIATIFSNENIYGLSKRLLGDAGRWKELVILNKLKYPYISPTGDGVNVLTPNSSIIYPQSTNNNTGVQTTYTPETIVDASKFNARLGVDLLLNSNQTSGYQLFDIKVGSNGDLELNRGLSNMTQAVMIKFNTEQGELSLYPGFGNKLPVGNKIRVKSLVEYQISSKAALLLDSRIQDVIGIDVRAEGDVVRTNVNLAITGEDSAVSISADSIR